MKQKVDPLVEHGHKVFVSYQSSAFIPRETFKALLRPGPSPQFQEWLVETAGPMGILWTTEKAPDRKGIFVYFYQAQHAMLAKLTWGGQ